MFSFKKAWLSLSRNQRKYSFFIFALMLISMILEALSIGIVLPLLSIILKGEAGTSFFTYFFSFDYFDEENLILIGLLVTMIIFLIKNCFLIFNMWSQTKFSENIYRELSNKLFRGYLKKDYIFFLKTNTSILIQNIRAEVVSFQVFFNRYMIFCGEIIIFFGIACTLFYVDAFGTSIILLSVSVFTIFIYGFTRKKIKIFGLDRIKIDREIFKHLTQGLYAAKDVKLLDRTKDLSDRVSNNLYKFSKINLFINFVGALPKFLFEILVVFVFVILILSMLKLERSTVDIVQYLGVFAVASFRIIPGVAKLLTSYQQIKFREPSVAVISSELNKINNSIEDKIIQNENSKMPLKFQDEINIKDLCFSYPDRKEFSLSKISINIKKGDFIGIIGETGSGKSTLINLFTGLLHPSEGKIEVDKSNIEKNLSSWHKKIGYVPQSIYLIDDTIKKNIGFGLKDEDIDDRLLDEAIKKANLSEFIDSLPDGLETVVGEKGIRISGGQLQRVGIARALYREPEILILDEATSSLDHITEKKIMDSVQFLKRKKTLVIITHRLSTVEKCDRIYFIDKGKITKQGSAEEVLRNT